MPKLTSSSRLAYKATKKERMLTLNLIKNILEDAKIKYLYNEVNEDFIVDLEMMILAEYFLNIPGIICETFKDGRIVKYAFSDGKTYRAHISPLDDDATMSTIDFWQFRISKDTPTSIPCLQ